ncbi:MAG: lipopolysaccharide biosynthesis protein [Nitrococcus mobilis]|nr:lipopolysaccharide biosynthesis protein [Nitrococcus mobilis]
MAVNALRSQVLQGLGWVGGTRLVGQIITWATTILVIRLLDPSAYGLMGMATIFTQFLMLLSEAGLNPAVIQARELEAEDIRNVQGSVLLISAGLAAALGLSAPLIAGFFGEPRLTGILYALSMQFLLVGLYVVPEALLERGMQYRGWSLVNLAALVAGGFTTLGFAYAGQGVWALVWGTLANFVTRAIGINLIARQSLRPGFQLQRIVPLIRFGGYVTTFRLIWFFYEQADFLIVGKMLGKDALGFYSVSYQLASMPMQRTFGILNRIAFPAFARVQEHPELVGRYYLKSARLVSFIGVPVLWGIAAVAPDAVPLVLGEQWHAAILPLQIIALMIPLRMTNNLLSPALSGFGRVDIGLRIMVRTAIVMPCAFLIGTYWGIVGVSLAWAIAWPAVFFINLGYSLPILRLRRRDLLQAISRSWLAGISMLAAIAAAAFILPVGINPWIRLTWLIVVGASAYTGVSMMINRSSLLELLDLVRRK